MGSSEPRRERLVTPLGLGVVGAAFAAAFVLFGPSRDAFSLPAGTGAAAGEDSVGAAPDALTLAYLRARAASSGLEESEAVQALLGLAGDGRAHEARALLDDFPSLVRDPLAQRRIAFALAVGDWRRAQAQGSTPAVRERTDVLLRAQLHGLLDTSLTARHTPLLERAVPLAVALGDDVAIERLHRALAAIEPDRAAHWLGRCGRTLGARGQRAQAIGCLQEAERIAVTPSVRFRLQLERLALSGADPSRRALGETLLRSSRASTADLQALAAVLLAGEMPGLAARAYARLAEHEPEEATTWLPLAARWAEAAGQPARAAAWLDRLLDTATASEERVPHWRGEIERLLLAAGDEAAALRSIAARVEATPDDAGLLDEAVRLASSIGAVAQALQWNTAYLDGRDDAPEVRERQIELAIAAGNPGLARRWAERALADAPDDAAQRRRLAQLAEWTGAPETALEQQRWLAEHGGGTDAYAQVARLAESLRRPAVSAAALHELVRRRSPDQPTVTRLVHQYELDGRPDLAADALREIMRLHGETGWRWRTLARLHTHHLHLADALKAWEEVALRIGRDGEETLARIELHWQLGQRDAAADLATDPIGLSFAGPATDHQARLLAEIGWQYRNPAVSETAAPLLAGIEDEQDRLRQARRTIDALEDEGRVQEAMRVAEQLWQGTGDGEFVMIASGLALETGDIASADRWLAVAADDATLVATPGYWTLRAGAASARGDMDAARKAYLRALEHAPLNMDANGGLLWLTIGAGDTAGLRRLLEERVPLIGHLPVLWPAIAVGTLEVGDAAASLPWFERALQSVGSDYGLVLGWADALERAGQVDGARRVRAFAVGELRTRLVDGVAGHEETLLRQYGRVLARHGRADDNEAWMRLMLSTDLDAGDAGRIWREDMAIAWLMSTERHEHARLIMARRHDERLATPPWQDMALALHGDDRDAIEAMLASGTGLSDGARMLALRRTGRDADAFALALRTLDAPSTPEDLAIAQAQYVDLRRLRPSHVSAGYGLDRLGALSIARSGISLRHAPGVAGLGIALDVTRSRFDSDTFQLDDGDERTNLLLGLFRRDARSDIALSVGRVSGETDERVYGQADATLRSRNARHAFGVSLGWREPADESAELRLAGQRDRFAATLDSSLDTLLFTRFEIETSELSARDGDDRLARGVAGRAEVGVRDTAGSLAWSASVAGEHRRHDRAERLPEAFMLSAGSSLDGVLPERRTALTLNASVSRGGTDSDFPDIASPRWYLAGSVGQVWPENEIGVQLDAGAGVRVIGNDELGVALGHGEGSGIGSDAAEQRQRTTRLGVSYRYHF